MRSSAAARARQRVAHQAEIKDDHASVGPDHDVGRLDVPMELALAVQRRHARHELPQDAPHQAGIGALALRTGVPASATGVRTYSDTPRPSTSSIVKKQCVRLHHQLIETHEVRMRDIGEAAEFPLETRDVGRARPQQGLERDRFVAHAVVYRVDDAHAARTEPAKDRESLRAAKLGLDLIRPVLAHDRR